MYASDLGRPRLLVVRTGARSFREYLLRSISPRYRIHMIVGVEPTWELEFIDGFTVQTDTLDTAAMVALSLDIEAGEHIDGVLCWDESRIPQAAAITATLGLPGPGPQVIARCRDKHLTRQALAAAGVAQPRSLRVDSVSQALEVAQQLGYPCILKPSDLALSLGVVKVDSPAELAHFFEFTRETKALELPDYKPRVLLEEYVDGEEISIDAALHGGEVYPLCVARKVVGYLPYCIEVGHYVHGDDPLLESPSMLALLRQTHPALGFTDGMTHTEIKLSPSGPKIIEVNGRLGGDMIPYLGLWATGIDVGLAAAAVACGQVPDTTRTRKAVAGVRFFYPLQPDTTIESVEFAGADNLSHVDMLTVLAMPGTVKSPPPDGTRDGRVAFATAIADTEAECAAALDAAQASLRVNGGPVGAG
jgi:predicted ATP-grasp superfamily ATP-dependent carboligase